MAERIPKIILFILLVFVANASYSQIDEVRVIDNKGTKHKHMCTHLLTQSINNVNI